MRILLINTLYPPLSVGGAERSVEELATGLHDAGHVVCVLSQKPASAGPVAEERQDGVSVIRWPLRDYWPFSEEWSRLNGIQRLGWHVRDNFRKDAARFVSRVIRDFQPDVVNTHNIAGFSPAVWDACQHQPLVHTIRDYYLGCARTTLYRRDHRCQIQCLDCRLLTSRWRQSRGPDMYVGVSADILQRHLDRGWISQAPGRVIYNQPRVMADKPTRMPEPTDARAYPKTFGFIGRLESAKGWDVALKAFQSLPTSSSNLLVAGGGRPEEVHRVREQIRRTDHVEYLGYTQPDEFYSLIHCALIPTQWAEPFGRTAYEARANGKYVIASRTGGLPEVLAGYPRCVLIDDFENPESWAKAMAAYLELLDTSSEALAVRSPRPQEPVATQYEALYADLVRNYWHRHGRT